MATILVTGGSVGLGFAMAQELIARGHRVFVCARSQADLAHASTLVPALTAIRADITSADDRETLLAEIESQAGAPDIIVNNAAICQAHDYTNPFTLSADRARAEIEVNLAAPIEMIRLFLERRHRAGRDQQAATIVNINTPGSLLPLEANPLYSTTKAGLHMFTLALRRQLRQTPVKVLEVFPPALDTNLSNALDVASQAAHGQDVITAVAQRIVNGILAHEETILPHPQSEFLYSTAVQNIDALIDTVNAGVKRRAGWDK